MLEAPPFTALGWFVRLLTSDIQETQLVVRIPGLPERLATFVRTGEFQMKLSKELVWEPADVDGYTSTIEVEPPDIHCPYTGRFFMQWNAGNNIHLTSILLTINNDGF